MVSLIYEKSQAMELKRFTDEEMAILRSNPYTYKVTQCQISFTTEFKELFLKHYNEGMATKDIMLSFGYDPEILGDNRINGIRMHIKKEFKKYGRFRSGRKPRRVYYSDNNNIPTNPADEVKQLRNEVEYLRQEVEFLKKISSIITSEKQAKS